MLPGKNKDKKIIKPFLGVCLAFIYFFGEKKKLKIIGISHTPGQKQRHKKNYKIKSSRLMKNIFLKFKYNNFFLSHIQLDEDIAQVF